MADLPSTERAERDNDALAKAQVLQEESTRDIAREAAPDMVRQLIKTAKGRQLPGKQRPTPNVMRQAAVDVLGQAHGRPETRDPGVSEGGGSGLTVIVNQLFGPNGPTEKVVQGERDIIDVPQHNVDNALKIASSIQDGIVKKMPR